MIERSTKEILPPAQYNFLPNYHIYERYFNKLDETERRLIDEILSGTIFRIQKQGVLPYLTGSVTRRVTEDYFDYHLPAENTERVRSTFERIHENCPDDPILQKLSHGPYDIDFKLGKNSDSPDPINIESILTKEVLVILNQIKDGDIQEFQRDGRSYFQIQTSSGSLVEYSWGAVATNPNIKNGQIKLIRNNSEMFDAHFALLPSTTDSILRDKRVGMTPSVKSQIVNRLITTNQGTVDIDPNSLRAAKTILDSPDDCETEAPSDSEQEVESALRTIRINLIHYKKLEDKSVYKSLFSERLWTKMTKVFDQARKDFKTQKPNEQLQQLLIGEMLICLETDPYLFLLIAEKTNLLKIFPAFSEIAPYFVRNLLTRDAFFTLSIRERPSTPGAVELLPMYMRNQKAILEARDQWYKSGNQESGLKIFYNAINNKLPDFNNLLNTEQFESIKDLFSHTGVPKFSHDKHQDWLKYYRPSNYWGVNHKIAGITSQITRDLRAQFYKNQTLLTDDVEKNYVFFAALGILTDIGDNYYVFTPPQILERIYDYTSSNALVINKGLAADENRRILIFKELEMARKNIVQTIIELRSSYSKFDTIMRNLGCSRSNFLNKTNPDLNYQLAEYFTFKDLLPHKKWLGLYYPLYYVNGNNTITNPFAMLYYPPTLAILLKL